MKKILQKLLNSAIGRAILTDLLLAFLQNLKALISKDVSIDNQTKQKLFEAIDTVDLDDFVKNKQ